MAELPTIDEMAKNIAEKALDNYEYKGKTIREWVELILAADVVEVETVAQMLYHALGDECPCNYGSSDEWLPEVCELQDECPNPKDKLGCWKQYIKHFGERRSE